MYFIFLRLLERDRCTLINRKTQRREDYKAKNMIGYVHFKVCFLLNILSKNNKISFIQSVYTL